MPRSLTHACCSVNWKPGVGARSKLTSTHTLIAPVVPENSRASWRTSSGRERLTRRQTAAPTIGRTINVVRTGKSTASAPSTIRTPIRTTPS